MATAELSSCCGSAGCAVDDQQGRDILIVEPTRSIARLISIVLDLAGHHPRVVSDSHAALEQIDKRSPDMIILETWLETRQEGRDLFHRLKWSTVYGAIPILMHTSDIQGLDDHSILLDAASRIAQAGRPGRADRYGRAAVDSYLVTNSTTIPGKYQCLKFGFWRQSA